MNASASQQKPQEGGEPQLIFTGSVLGFPFFLSLPCQFCIFVSPFFIIVAFQFRSTLSSVALVCLPAMGAKNTKKLKKRT
jgi:hypothetical protein